MFFFFVVAPFCSCPASLVSRKFFAVGPGCAKCFFLLRSVGRRDLSAGPEQKKNTTQGAFFCSGPGERQGKEKPRWAPARGQSKKKHHPGCLFFAAAPAKGKRRRSPVGRRHGARAQKKTPPRVFFFCSGPGERQGKEKPRWAPARGQSKKCFFLLWPRAGAQRGFSFPCLSPGPEQKKKNTLDGVFFFCSGPVPAPNGASPSLAFRRGRSKKKTPSVVFFFLLWPRASAQRGFSFPCLSPGPQQTKQHPGWCVFFAAAPRGRSLTHCGPGWRCLPLAGVVFFFLLRPRPDRGGVFFFCCGPARTLTHSRWAGAISARPGWCFFFFAAAPPGLFRQ